MQSNCIYIVFHATYGAFGTISPRKRANMAHPSSGQVALIFATTICWARQSGKRSKRLVCLIEKPYHDQSSEAFIQDIDERLSRLCLLDEQHRLYREYLVLLLCHPPCGVAVLPLPEKKRQDPVGSTDISSTSCNKSGLADCQRLAPAGPSGGAPCEENPTTPLYIDEVIRLLQYYTKIQPAPGLNKALAQQEALAYVRIALMSEEEVMTILHCLSQWIIPVEPSQDSAPQEGEKIKISPVAVPVPPRRTKVNPISDNAPTAHDANVMRPTGPKIIAYHKKHKKANDSGELSALAQVDNLSVLGICAKLKNECIERLEQHSYL